jgi:UV DNA damage endonuclease
MSRVGFCCKYLDPDQTQKKKVLMEIQQQRTERSTTVAWLKRQTVQEAEQRLYDIMTHNMQSAYNLVEYVGTLEDPGLHMVRLGSNQLPMYTQPDYAYFWQQPDIKLELERGFAKIGKIARELDVRLSFHPGQFCVLASETNDIVERSIEEFEYHVDMARWMGFGQKFQDFKCNVHISGRQGPAGIKDVLSRLSPEARNIITIENDENKWGIEASLELEKQVALVLDIHHHWVNSGEYIQPNDDRCKRIKDSWRGVRPALHYSVSREDYLVDHNPDELPIMESLLAQGYKKQKLRAHSEYYWNNAVNKWAATFAKDFDIQCESKCKNLASHKFYNNYIKGD